MFKFFEGALGEILAPVTGSSNGFFLAIQHHKNEDVQRILMRTTEMDMARVNENGYSTIHCASRYNNVFAIELCLNRGKLEMIYFKIFVTLYFLFYSLAASSFF
jgi:hypothetical protein